MPFWAAVLIGTSVQAAGAQEPSLSYSLERQRAYVGVPFRVTYEARWRGPADAVALLPSEPESVAWGSGHLVRSTSETEGEDCVVRYFVEFTANEPGTVEVPPFRVSYAGPEALASPAGDTRDEDQAEDAVPEMLTASAPAFTLPVSRRPNVWLVVLFSAVGASVLAGAGAYIVARRRGNAGGRLGNAARAVPSTAQAAINLARQHRLDGKFYEYYRELARGASLLAPSVAARKLREKLEQEAERVGYGALQPTDDDLEGAARDLERAIHEQTRGEE